MTLALVADAGAGKSRLAEDVVVGAPGRGVPVIHAVATAFDADVPYGALRLPFRAALGVTDHPASAVARLGALTTQPVDLLPLLGLPLGLDLGTTPRVEAIDSRFVASRRNELLAEVLLAAFPGPLLLVVEDLHDLDQASAGLLDVLALRAAPGVLAIVLTSRAPLSGFLDDQHWEVLPLEPLPPDQTRRLALAAAGDRALSDVDLARLVAESGGNPLFLRELVAFSPSASDPVPTSAEEVVAARIDTLGPAHRQLLREASVAGPVQRLEDLAIVLSDCTVADPARWAGLSDFVAVDTVSATPEDARDRVQLRFRHDLYRLSAYEGLAVRRRRALHAAFADHLISGSESLAPAATIAVHLHEAQRYNEAWHWSLKAARATRDMGALHDATSLFVRAIDAGSRAGVTPEELAIAQEELGDDAELIGQYDDADDALRLAARVGGDAVVGRRLVKRAAVLERKGRYRLALGLLTRAERRLAAEHIEAEHLGADHATGQAAPSPGWTALALRRSSVLHRLGRLQAAYDVAAEVATIAGVGVAAELRADRARALLRLEMIASEAGWPERFELGVQALAAFDGLDEDRDLACLLGNLGATAFESDDWSGARGRYEEAVEVYRRAGDVIGAAIAANNAGEILCEQGHVLRASEAFLEARRVFRAAGHIFGAGCTASSLGRVAARSGDPELAAALLDEACTSLAAMGSTLFATDARVRRVEAALLVGKPDAVCLARQVLQEVASVEVGAILPLTASRYLAIATAAAGNVTGAQQMAEAMLDRAAKSKAAYEESLALDLLAGLAILAGKGPDTEVLQRRDELWRELGIVATPVYPSIPYVPRRGGSV